MHGKSLVSTVLRRFAWDRRGGTLTLTAVVFPAVIGFSGLALDGANWYAQRRAAQTMADAAAVAGAYARLAEQDQTEIEAAARTEAERNGFDGTSGDAITVTQTPAVPKGQVTPLIEARVARTVDLYFTGLLTRRDSVTIAARAVSGVRNLGPQCVIALNETIPRAIEVTGNTTADIGCGVASNSNDPDEAMLISGDAVLRANPAQAVGKVDLSGSGTLDSKLPPLSFSPPAPDPFKNLPHPPDTSECDALPKNAGQGITIGALADLPLIGLDGIFTFCGDLSFNGPIALPPGQYVVRGDFALGPQADVTGVDVTFFLSGDPPEDTGNVQNMNGGRISLTAPTSGDYQGLLFYQDRRTTNCASNGNKFNGGIDMDLNGVIYFPACDIDFNGGAGNPDNCLQIIADTVKFSGNSFIRNDPALCQQLGLTGFGFSQQQVVLVE